MVPGCEPVSAATSSGFPADIRDACNCSYITLKAAMEAIPEAEIIWSTRDDQRYFVLPDGPPPDYGECPGESCPTDWYGILREHANCEQPPEEEESLCFNKPGNGLIFDFHGCNI